MPKLRTSGSARPGRPVIHAVFACITAALRAFSQTAFGAHSHSANASPRGQPSYPALAGLACRNHWLLAGLRAERELRAALSTAPPAARSCGPSSWPSCAPSTSVRRPHHGTASVSWSAWPPPTLRPLRGPGHARYRLTPTSTGSFASSTPNVSRTPALICLASASSVAVSALPGLVSASVCLVSV